MLTIELNNTGAILYYGNYRITAPQKPRTGRNSRNTLDAVSPPRTNAPRAAHDQPFRLPTPLPLGRQKSDIDSDRKAIRISTLRGIIPKFRSAPVFGRDLHVKAIWIDEIDGRYSIICLKSTAFGRIINPVRLDKGIGPD